MKKETTSSLDIYNLLEEPDVFTQFVIEQLQDHETRLIDQDREQARLVHDLAELSTRIIQMNRLLYSVNERLSQLEAKTDRE